MSNAGTYTQTHFSTSDKDTFSHGTAAQQQQQQQHQQNKRDTLHGNRVHSKCTLMPSYTVYMDDFGIFVVVVVFINRIFHLVFILFPTVCCRFFFGPFIFAISEQVSDILYKFMSV